MSKSFIFKALVNIALLTTALSCDGIKDLEAIPIKRPAEKLTFEKLTKVYTNQIFTKEILSRIKGKKEGYVLKEIKDVTPKDVLTVEGETPDFILKLKKAGSVTVTLVFHHPKKKPSVVKASFEIVKQSAETLTFDKLTKPFSVGGKFSAAEILVNIKGNKQGYTIKQISNITNHELAEIRGNEIYFKNKIGTFSVTLHLQHNNKADVMISLCQFGILNKQGAVLNWTRQGKVFSTTTEISEKELMSAISGDEKDSYSIKQVVIKDADNTGATVSGKRIIGIIRKGTLKLEITLENPVTTDVVVWGEYTVSKAKAALLTFDVLSAKFKLNDEITSDKIMESVKGIKGLYKVKDIKDVSDSKAVSVVRRGRVASLKMLEQSVFTVTLVLEHPTKADVVLKQCKFEVYYDLLRVFWSSRDYRWSMVELYSGVNRKVITKLIIPTYVASKSPSCVFYDAFKNCVNLKEVYIPNSVGKIDESAFYNCIRLPNVVIPNSVREIGKYAFKNCSSLTDVTIPTSVTNVGYSPFYGCSSLTEIRVSRHLLAQPWVSRLTSGNNAKIVSY